MLATIFNVHSSQSFSSYESWLNINISFASYESWLNINILSYQIYRVDFIGIQVHWYTKAIIMSYGGLL